MADSPLPMTTPDVTCHYGNQSTSFYQAPPGEHFDILKSAALLAGICPDQSSPEIQAGRGTKRKNAGYYGDASWEFGLNDTSWTQSGYDVNNDTGFEGDVGSDLDDEDSVYIPRSVDCFTSTQSNDLYDLEPQKKRSKHTRSQDLKGKTSLHVSMSSDTDYEPITAQPTDFDLSTYSTCFGYGIGESQTESVEQQEYSEHDVIVPVTSEISDSDASESITIHYNVDENKFTVAMAEKCEGSFDNGRWMDDYDDGEYVESASEESSDSDTSVESSISGSLCGSSFSDSDNSDHDSGDDSFCKEDKFKYSSDSENSDSDSNNDSCETEEEPERHPMKNNSQFVPRADTSTPKFMQLLRYYLSRKDSGDQPKCSYNLSSELCNINAKYEIQRDFDEPQSDLDMDISSEEIEDMECPRSCICNTGKSETLSKMKRQFRVLEPLYKTVLQRRAMRYSNRYSYACCERNCSLKRRWRSVHMSQVKTDYHESDLRVSHYSWGDWEEGEEEEELDF